MIGIIAYARISHNAVGFSAMIFYTNGHKTQKDSR
jgi:hypothetical protein